MMERIWTPDVLFHIFRWIHFMAGIVWIGHLYYFNFSQTPFFSTADAQTKSGVVRGLVPTALWWFRWGAAFTFLSGLVMLDLAARQSGGWGVFATSYGMWIIMGAALGTIMAANVWFIIWPCQKVVIASANAVANGGQAIAEAAAKGARASVASRTNVLFSVPMLFFMGASRHLPVAIGENANFMGLFIAMLVLIGVIQLNAMFGKLAGPLKSVAGVIHAGLLLTVIMYVGAFFFI